jgi:hypothetical protein
VRWLSPILAVLISVPFSPAVVAQTTPQTAATQSTGPKLNLIVIEGEGAINNVRQRTAREPIVQVEDENHKPVAGAAVVFLVADQGAGGSFAGGAHSLTVITNNQGQAIARGFHPNTVQGHFEIHVTASTNGQTATAVIAQSNVLAGGAAAGASAGISGKLIAVLVIAAAAAAGGAYYATHSGGGSSSTIANGTSPGSAAIVITAGAGVVGPPK